MKKADKILLIVWAVVPPVLLWFLPSNFFISSLLYLVLPSVYFSLKVPRIIHKALIAASTGLVFGIVLDYFAFLNKAWTVPTIFPLRFFKFIPVEDLFFTFFAVYVVVVAYYYFFKDRNYTKINTRRLHFSWIFISIGAILFLVIYTYAPNVLIIPYYYFWLVLLFFIIPTIILFIFFPPYHKHLLAIILYLIVLMLPWEIIANALQYWSFPTTEYIGMIHLFGQSFPIEEFLNYMILFAPGALAFTEFIEGTDTPARL